MAHARRTWIAVRCAGALAVVLLPLPALAQGSPDPPPEAAAQDAYKQHMTNGVKLFQDRNFAAAIAEFEAAYAAKPNANPLVNVALCHKAMFNYPKAIAALKRALSEHGQAMSAEDRTAAEGAIREMEGLLAFVTVDITPPSATLLIDGEPHAPGTWSNPVALAPGAHRIGARADGYAPVEQQITVVSGDAGKTVALSLAADTGQVTIVAVDKETAIAIDKKQVSAGEWKGPLSPGSHLIQFFKGGTLVRETQILVTAGKEASVREADLPEPSGTKKDAVEPEPLLRGFYGLVTAGIFLPADAPGATVDTAAEEKARDALGGKSGGAVGVRGGYRLSNVVALELMTEFRRLDKTFEREEAMKLGLTQGTESTYESLRVGGDLRLMTPARRARFVGSIGLGASLDRVRIGNDNKGDPQLNFFAFSEIGLEFDFDGVLVGLAAQQAVGTEGASVGAGVRVGYGVW